ncbi:leucine-rich repeat and coiled-coil domain-containing protein 1-like isoform X2 [Rhopilema esculentum]|uniref:leucine-rich repeat and coiled-coil domain-containing protein 1-like isoform X2 n=1 Tax=Rhopilema esculentum TaxID=499914 RepID=UPI0031D95DFC|eukprot:gene1401-15815_t
MEDGHRYADQLGQNLSLIDHKVHKLVDLPLPRDLVHLNLHCNEIARIENLHGLRNLRSLDLSSNVIVRIEGLEYLENLQSLNLSCNQIKVVAGLGSLRKLEKLNLSYNIIDDLTGLKDFRRNTHVIKFVDLHGNKITSLDHLLECIANCGTLEHLTLQKNGDSNPVCSIPAYRPNVFAQVKNLVALDEKDKHGNATVLGNVQQISHPGLDEYLQWLVQSNPSDSTSATVSSDSQIDVNTPKIDEALERFKDRARAQKVTDVISKSQSMQNENEEHKQNEVTDRLHLLEKQIESLLNLQIQKQMIPEKDIETITPTSASTSPETTGTQQQKPRGLTRRKAHAKESAHRDCKITKRVPAIKRNVIREVKTSSSDEVKRAARKVRDPKDDEAALLMLQELDEERERRWKAEQAARRLINTVKDMQEKVAEERKYAETAISTSAKLKSALALEKDERTKCEKLLVLEQDKCEELKGEVAKLRQYENEAKKIISSLEETSRNSDRERLKVQALKDKQLQEAQFKAAAITREVELLQESEKNLKQRVSQLQELLANREQNHITSLDGMVKLDGKEVRDIVEKEVAKQEGRYSQLMQQYNERLEARNRDYALLEDEFRAGLQMEANRFGELQGAYSKLLDESSEMRRSMQILKQKESKATALVTELTSMVKEQKGRLTEVSRNKQEMQVDFKERIQLLENQLEASRKQLSKMETFRQDKDKLLAQVKAQESLIEGLRAERKLWGEELAQQGASLAHDRGRLEAQIEALTSQVKQMKQREQENLDTLKIKTKLIEDQTDTIKNLKQELAIQKTEIKKAKEDLWAERRDLEQELKEEKKNSNEFQEVVEALQSRKEELKSQLGISNMDLEKAREDLRILKKQWDERSLMIDQLEQKVVKMKNNFDNKEKNLREERDAALKTANLTREKLKTCDDSFRRQLDENQRNHDLKLRQVIASKDDEISKTKAKVTEVEDEMRALLEEAALSKQNLEMKIKQLGKAFSDVQLDLGR